MLIALMTLVFVANALVLILLMVVIVGMRQEPRAEMSSRAPSVLAGMVRRLVGVSVRRPDQGAEDQRNAWLVGHGAEGERR